MKHTPIKFTIFLLILSLVQFSTVYSQDSKNEIDDSDVKQLDIERSKIMPSNAAKAEADWLIYRTALCTFEASDKSDPATINPVLLHACLLRVTEGHNEYFRRAVH